MRPHLYKRYSAVGGGLYCPSPSPLGFPLYQENMLCLLPSPDHKINHRKIKSIHIKSSGLVKVANPSSTAQRGRGSPLP